MVLAVAMEEDLTGADQTVEHYIAARDEPARTVLQALRELVRETLPGATEGMKWGAPVYYDKRGEAIIYLYGGKDHAHLGFVQGVELDDPDRILIGSGKTGRHVKCPAGEAINPTMLVPLLRQCSSAL